jgi:uncharacterized protein YecT (DUF1311 family)
MKTFVPTVVILLLLAPVLRARGQSAVDPCTEGTSPQQLACAGRELKAATDQLKRARAELFEVLEPRPRLKLRAAERLWLSYRKSNCEAEASVYEGGTIQPLIRLRCMARVTRERAAELKAQSQTLSGTNENED